MSLLLTEDSSFLTTEDGNHILIEPVNFFTSSPKSGRSGGTWLVTATDYGYLVETGSGTLKLNSKYMLDLEARNAGATLRWN